MATHNTVPHNFLGLPGEYSGYEGSRVVILPVPFERTTTYRKGTRQGPEAIISASQNLELYDEELQSETYKVGIHTFDPLEPLPRPRDMVDRVEHSAEGLIGHEKFTVILGGEHTVSLGVAKALRSTYPSLSVLSLDAHADLRDTYSGTPYSHACVMRRISEIAPVVEVGVRSLSEEEALFAEEKNVPIYSPLEIDTKREELLSKLTEEVYVTIDLDVLDPSIMPSVGTPEPGGLLWYETLALLREVAETKKVLGFDVVELCPIPDNPAPDFTAAKLIYRFLGYLFAP